MFGEHKVRGHGPCSGSMVMADGPAIVCFCSFFFFFSFVSSSMYWLYGPCSGSEVMADGHTIVVSEGHRSSPVHQGGQN